MAIGLGLIGAGWLIASKFDKAAFLNIDWSWNIAFWVLMAFVCIGVRDLAYMIRLRILTHKELSWKQLFEVIFLWEFGSSITPSVVGGAPIAIFLLSKEGIKVGKSTTIVFLTALFDELFFVIMVPVLLFFLKGSVLFPVDSASIMSISTGTKFVFWVSYGLIVLYCIFLSFGIFVNPKAFKFLLSKLFSLPILNRWRDGAIKTGDEIIVASQEARKESIGHWIKCFIATYFSWTARYWVVNCLIMAFVLVDDHILIYARQLVMWVIMLISPTPGGSGIAEYAFSVYLQEFIPKGLDGTLALLWRLVSYYPYLIIGVILLPRWVRRVYIKRKLISFKKA
ncbi:MAG: flippase-like domain-containing protein [Flavobacteriales bacterium]|nr:flippase-like domain-containing protein [Flavobacteriales bacterium]